MSIQESLVFWGGIKIENELKEETSINLASEKEEHKNTRIEKKSKPVEER